jgi:hypothetical protein
MQRVARVLSLTALVMGTAGVLPTATDATDAVTVHVQRDVLVRANLHVSFKPVGKLPTGGYYYAVIVLKPYKHYTREHPPPCSTSSDMEKTDYGYSHGSRTVALALTPYKSQTEHWCPKGSYLGGIYAVPEPPPCESTYPCRSEPYERPSPCWGPEGHRVCGLVAPPRRYKYPQGLPVPRAKGARIIARFTVTFP